MDAVLQELKKEEEKALRARIKKAKSSSTRCRPSARSLPSSQLQSSRPSVSRATAPAQPPLQDGRLDDQLQQKGGRSLPVMLPSRPLGPRVDRDLLHIDSEVLSVRKAALSSLHELLVPSAADPLQVCFQRLALY
jgi:hypothetical protein